jgi:L-glyceraldehyde 3-phosphate reductase
MDLRGYRDELIISSKAGYYMWPGPYGEWGSRKYLISSLDQSLKRMGLDYVDIFYHHRPDLDTPMEETMGALDQILRSGKALYVGISNYNHTQTHKASEILREFGHKCLIHQPSYSMFNRWIEESLINTLEDENMGCIVFSPLAQGILTNKYLDGIPEESRAAKPHGFLKKEQITADMIDKARKLSLIAERRGQSLAQLAISWVLRHSVVTSALIGASRKEQILECVGALANLSLNADELKEIDLILEK